MNDLRRVWSKNTEINLLLNIVAEFRSALIWPNDLTPNWILFGGRSMEKCNDNATVFQLNKIRISISLCVSAVMVEAKTYQSVDKTITLVPLCTQYKGGDLIKDWTISRLFQTHLFTRCRLLTHLFTRCGFAAVGRHSVESEDVSISSVDGMYVDRVVVVSDQLGLETNYRRIR